MLPRIHSDAALQQHFKDYLTQLAEQGFQGDIETGYSNRLAVATDNSVYQRLPQAVIHPKDVKDLCLIGRLGKVYPKVSFSARGGGTGTNGQSLTSGIVVDLSRHMNKILEFNQQEGWVRVQAGVVKDQLNAFLKPYGYFFAPDLSTSNRATIGGMINTDASGQGSLVYGKTSDHVLALRSVLADGRVLDTQPMATETVETQGEQLPERSIYQQVLTSCRDKREQILAKFPRMNRFLTGYDLEHVFNDDLSQFDLSRVITGSEGSLAFVAEAKLNVTPIARCKALANVKYDSFESALRHAPQMVEARATSVETVDSKVLNLAREDIIWHEVSDLIQDVPGKELQGLNMVEYNASEQADMDDKITELKQRLDADIKQQKNGVIGYQITYESAEIGKIYAMRKKAVGLLGKTKGRQKPLAFAEDTAVPPENLADFIMEFRALLDSKGLNYGMFGHVDAGVLHVRPALDLCDPEQEALMHSISDEVVALVAKYGGLMWGEHGKGYRSEYGPEFFGEELFTELRKIKAVFDPHNQMNPGKICTPYGSEAELVKVSDTKRAHFDKQIPIAVRDSYRPAMDCNGNGLCFNYDAASPMCPSFKITGDRRHSPKGRAGMVREWLRLLSGQNLDPDALEKQAMPSWWQRWRNSRASANDADFSHEVREVMDGCLACKACASQCPVNVDVPSFRARFLNLYYQRYARPLKDYMVANIEKMAPRLAKMPRLVNTFTQLPPSRWLLKKVLGYVDTPVLSTPTLADHTRNLPEFDLAQLQQLPDEQRQKHVLIVQDPFTSFYEAQLVADFASLVERLGYQPVVLPFVPNGKPQHVKGFLRQFADTAKTAAEFLNQVHHLKIPMIGMDASLVLCYRDEYQQVLGEQRGDFQVLLAHEWLQGVELPELSVKDKEFALFAHCTEKTALPASEKQWQQVFSKLGAQLTPISVGCCGMAGTYGHEASHLDQSRGLFELGWQPKLADCNPDQVLATGYSCRSQVQRFASFKPKHPIQALLQLLQEAKDDRTNPA
ncbi:(S)-2-hydroxy-acid oxidase [Saliniradius amylolyticus]|uniref:D-2-hydroxyglutarate dehydrogenase n=1 Tax=Saliniradius amylolyticus TaxID=2183582 RepID=A0A2S2E3C3_9ALTE|nr:FAD-binding and (Fe-S)-binding domain-containing protein [Saliniradius amylolyticus]AWL12099.1 (S)-2-hydroxy-acid oxidase [Saliniradius amylolyticus]